MDNLLLIDSRLEITDRITAILLNLIREPSSLILLASLLIFPTYLLYSALLPHPIVGIPHNKAATRSLLGDLPALKHHIRITRQFFSWPITLCEAHASPIVQAFAVPFHKPWVIVSDPRECYDILLRRSKEFDRSAIVGDWLSAINPKHQIAMALGSVRFKKSRALVKGLMVPAFLERVYAPNVGRVMGEFVRLWQAKVDEAGGRPWDAHRDAYDVAFDMIWSGLVPQKEGEETGLARSRRLLEVVDDRGAEGEDDEIRFKEVKHLAVREAFLGLADCLERVLEASVPKVYVWWMQKTPTYRRHLEVRHEYFCKTMREALVRMEQGGEVECVVDDVLKREIEAAQKEGRKPDLNSEYLEAEILGFITGGYHTTSTAIMWSLKLLADHPIIQSTLRTHLYAYLKEPGSSSNSYTPSTILRTHLPYLDATIHELFRHSRTKPGSVRTALTDTVILGHCIPEGTDVFLLGTGPGFFSPGYEIDEALRSPSAQANRNALGSWNEEDMDSFKPERWLTTCTSASGEEELTFDSNAGPNLVFGLGHRGCFGKKLAYLQMRMFVVMTVWHFELLKCPEGLSGYDASDGVAHHAVQSFVRVRRVGGGGGEGRVGGKI